MLTCVIAGHLLGVPWTRGPTTVFDIDDIEAFEIGVDESSPNALVALVRRCCQLGSHENLRTKSPTCSRHRRIELWSPTPASTAPEAFEHPTIQRDDLAIAVSGHPFRMQHFEASTHFCGSTDQSH